MIKQKTWVKPRLTFGLAGLAIAVSSATYAEDFYGTTEAYASESIYFVVTDRFVNGDNSNDQVNQGTHVGQGTWDRSMPCSDGSSANIGYLGGDFAGIYNNADYIADMGFTSVWITPIVENPDEAFTGGGDLSCGTGVGADKGKTGYHGYWGVNFYEVDEHLESNGLSFQEFNTKMESEFGIKTVLDIVANHGSPSYQMTQSQEGFGKIFDQNGTLKADHMNLEPGQLSDGESLHDWYNRHGGLAQLSDFNENDPEVMDYLVGAYLKWIEQGADAFRIDTIAWMPHSFWKEFSDRIRAVNPDFYMFGENFNFNAGTIAQHQKPENGAISVLDFPARSAITQTFQNPNSDYSSIQWYLDIGLTDNTYTNPYDLATFYDNHDMSRMDSGGNENVFIDAHNWLFTSRGIPVVYYGSEMQFMQSKSEHSGNRNYYGQNNVNAARNGNIYGSLSNVANIRKASVALQKGLQVNLEFGGQKAAFLRAYEKDGVNQTALVLLNKGDAIASFNVAENISSGVWTDAETGQTFNSTGSISTTVEGHGVKVLLFNELNNDDGLIDTLVALMAEPPEKVLIDPATITAGQPVTVSYYAVAGSEIELHWGIDGWSGGAQANGDIPMIYNSQTKYFEATVASVPEGATQFDFVFHDIPSDTWDNNDGADWHYPVNDVDPMTPPNTPTGFKAIAGNQKATLSWNATARTDSYSVYGSVNGDMPVLVDTINSGTSLVVESLINGNTYTYTILATNVYGDSALSASVDVIPNESYTSVFGESATLHLTGIAFSDWNPANAEYQLQLIGDNTWQANVVVPTALTNSAYKFTLNGAWGVNWGGGATGLTANLNRSGADATITLSPGAYVLTVTEGNSIDASISVNWAASGDPVLSVSPTVVDLGDVVVGTQTASNITLINAGGGTLSVEDATESATWMDATLTGLNVAVTVDTTGLIVGMAYSDNILVSSNGGDEFVEVRFNVIDEAAGIATDITCFNGNTNSGQSVYIVGSVAELGAWDVALATKLAPTAYPTWTGTVTLPASTAITWKCIKRDETVPTQDLVWQGGADNSINTPVTGTSASSGSF